jgi:DNA-binding MarR family transcriptional regulator
MRSSKSTRAHQVLRLDDFMPFLLSTASNGVSNLIAQAYQTRFGLNIPQWRVLAVLSERRGLVQQELCDRTLMDKVTVSRAVQSLSTRGLVGRSPHATDRRSHVLVLSEIGKRLVNEVAPAALAIEKAAFKEFNPAEMEILCSLLKRVRTTAQELVNEIRPSWLREE